MQLAKLPQLDGTSVTGMVVPAATAQLIRARLFMHLAQLPADGGAVPGLPRNLLDSVAMLRSDRRDEWTERPHDEKLGDIPVQLIVQHLDAAGPLAFGGHGHALGHDDVLMAD